MARKQALEGVGGDFHGGDPTKTRRVAGDFSGWPDNFVINAELERTQRKVNPPGAPSPKERSWRPSGETALQQTDQFRSFVGFHGDDVKKTVGRIGAPAQFDARPAPANIQHLAQQEATSLTLLRLDLTDELMLEEVQRMKPFLSDAGGPVSAEPA